MTTAFTGGTPSVTYAITGDTNSCFQMSGANLQPKSLTGSCAPGTSQSITITASASGFSGTPSVSVATYAGRVFFIATTGNDSTGTGASGSPWLSPNHAVHCGDVITLANSTSYSGFNFAGSFGGGGTAKWGAVTCPGNDNVAWVKAATFDAVKFSTFGPQAAVEFSANYWGIQGVECDAPTVTQCFTSDPPTSGASIHHLVVANTVCNGAGSTSQLSCIQANEFGGGTGPSGVDYYVWLGNITDNGDPGNSECGSNISDAASANSDTASGTHRYIALNVVYHSNGGIGCNGTGTTSDDNGIIMDSPNINSATGATLIEANLVAGNGGTGIHVFANGCCAAAGGAVLPVIMVNNTIYNDFQNAGFNSTTWGLNVVGQSNSAAYFAATVDHNIVQETSSTHAASGTCTANDGTGCIYPLGEQYLIAASSELDDNWIDGKASFGSNINWVVGYKCRRGSNVGTPSPDPSNTSCDNNILATDPAFVSVTLPGAPSCGAAVDTLACESVFIANFKATGTGTTVSGTSVNAINYGGVNSSGKLAPAACVARNSTPFILNVERMLPADMDPCG